jgi:hypothetical protein
VRHAETNRDHLAAMVARIVRIETVSCDSAHEAALDGAVDP